MSTTNKRPPPTLEQLDERVVPSVSHMTYIACDYDALGLFLYSYKDYGVGSFRQLTRSNPESVDVNPNGQVVADFGGYGVMLWTATAGWKQLSRSNPQSVGISNYDTYDRVFIAADFGPGWGVYSYNSSKGWRCETRSDPQKLVVSDQGDMVGDFGGLGVYRSFGGGRWTQLTTANAQDITVGSTGVIGADFGSSGVWVWYADPSIGWRRLSYADAQALSMGAYGHHLIGDFGSQGIWSYNPGTHVWTREDTANPFQIGAATNGDFVATFSNGMWMHDYYNGWIKLWSSPSQFAVSGHW